MKILESIFKGVILECPCGETTHVRYKDLHDYVCSSCHRPAPQEPCEIDSAAELALQASRLR